MADVEKGGDLDTPKDDLTPNSPVSLESDSNKGEKMDKASATEPNVQSILVDWDGPDDPDFPQNL